MALLDVTCSINAVAMERMSSVTIELEMVQCSIAYWDVRCSIISYIYPECKLHIITYWQLVNDNCKGGHMHAHAHHIYSHWPFGDAFTLYAKRHRFWSVIRSGQTMFTSMFCSKCSTCVCVRFEFDSHHNVHKKCDRCQFKRIAMLFHNSLPIVFRCERPFVSPIRPQRVGPLDLNDQAPSNLPSMYFVQIWYSTKYR